MNCFTNSEILQSEQQKKNEFKKRVNKSLQKLWDTTDRSNLYITGVKEEGEMTESLLKEIMTENFSNLESDPDTKVHETNRQSQNFNSNNFLQDTL